MQKYPNVSHSMGGMTSNQEYGWYGSQGGNVKNNELFHKPIRKSGVTGYVDNYHLTWGINPFKLKSATEFDVAKQGAKPPGSS